MSLLQLISGRAHYIAGTNNLGLVLTGDGGAIAIDTGIDKDSGRQIRKALDAAGATLQAIISTHHHADHIGGNEFLVRAYPGVAVYAPRLEAGLIEQPELEPIYLSYGAAPVAALKTKWLMAKGVAVTERIKAGPLEVAGVTLDILPLHGHSIGQIGVTVDSVCFAADSFFGVGTLDKHGIPYAHEIAAQRTSLDALAAHQADFFVPGHGPLTTQAELGATLAANRAAIVRATESVLAVIAQPVDLFAVADRVRQAYGLSFAGLPQYAIFLGTVSAHLSYLEAQGLAAISLSERGAVWAAR